LKKIGYVRKFRPKRFHQIDSRLEAGRITYDILDGQVGQGGHFDFAKLPFLSYRAGLPDGLFSNQKFKFG
jgi:hypothetical protein